MFYRPSRVGPQQGYSCLVLFKPMQRDGVRFRSKGKLYALIREWRGTSFYFTAHIFPERPWAGLLYRVPVCGEGRGSRGAQFSRGLSRCAAQVAQMPVRGQRLRTRPAAILNWAVGVGRSHFSLGTLVWSAWCKASARGPLRASETGRSTKEKMLDFILLPRFYIYFPGIVNGLCRWQML